MQMQILQQLKHHRFHLIRSATNGNAGVTPGAGDITVDAVAKLINDHPHPLPRHVIPSDFLSSPLLDSVLERLFAAHSDVKKTIQIFRLAINSTPANSPPPSAAAFATALHILTRARHFDDALQLLDDVAASQPTLLAPKALAVVLSRVAKFRPFDETLDAFGRAERAWSAAGRAFGVEEFNALLRAYCALGRVAEARAVFRRLHSCFPPNSRTLNTLLLGFKESGNLVAFDLFYHEMMARGFEPDAVTFCIRIDAYCKRMRFLDALHVFDEMKRRNCEPTVKTVTTLIHGAGIVKDSKCARKLFDEMCESGLSPDRGAYNALMGALLKVGDLGSAMQVMNEMELKGFDLDDVSYYTVFSGLKKSEDLEGFWKLYNRMVEKNFVPRTRTVMLVMRVFCENGRSDIGLGLWDYLVDKGCCPHRHALDLLVTALCCRKKVTEAYRCFRQLVDRGRVPSQRTFRVLEGFFVQSKDSEKLAELGQVMKALQVSVPHPS